MWEVKGEPEGTAFAAESVRWSAGRVGMVSGSRDGGVPREAIIYLKEREYVCLINHKDSLRT